MWTGKLSTLKTCLAFLLGCVLVSQAAEKTGSSGATVTSAEPVQALKTLKVSADSWVVSYDVSPTGLVISAVFKEVFPKTSLWKHGVRSGDVILKVDGTPVSSMTGEEFATLFQRGIYEGEKKTLTLKCGHRDLFFRRPEYTLSLTPNAPADKKTSRNP